MPETITLEPHWPSLLRFFTQAAKDYAGTAKGRRFALRAEEIRVYIAAHPDKAA